MYSTLHKKTIARVAIQKFGSEYNINNMTVEDLSQNEYCFTALL